MKKFVIFISIVFIVLLEYVNNKADTSIVIPDSAIRVRVIANSNTIRDQSMKMLVKEYIEDNLSMKLLDVEDIDEAREIINSNMDDLNIGINDIFKREDYNLEYNINFGDNYFPSKEYRGILYNDGVYESLVVTIGSGDGDNWWCVLFPPLCLLDAHDSEGDDVVYRSWVKDMLDRIF